MRERRPAPGARRYNRLILMQRRRRRNATAENRAYRRLRARLPPDSRPRSAISVRAGGQNHAHGAETMDALGSRDVPRIPNTRPAAGTDRDLEGPLIPGDGAAGIKANRLGPPDHGRYAAGAGRISRPTDLRATLFLDFACRLRCPSSPARCPSADAERHQADRHRPPDRVPRRQPRRAVRRPRRRRREHGPEQPAQSRCRRPKPARLPGTSASSPSPCSSRAPRSNDRSERAPGPEGALA